jgi:hypothetical protein
MRAKSSQCGRATRQELLSERPSGKVKATLPDGRARARKARAHLELEEDLEPQLYGAWTAAPRDRGARPHVGCVRGSAKGARSA